MGKRIVTPSRPVVLTPRVAGWYDTLRQNTGGTIVFVAPATPEGYPFGRWSAVVATSSGVNVIELELEDYQPLFRLTQALMTTADPETLKNAVKLKVMSV